MHAPRTAAAACVCLPYCMCIYKRRVCIYVPRIPYTHDWYVMRLHRGASVATSLVRGPCRHCRWQFKLSWSVHNAPVSSTEQCTCHACRAPALCLYRAQRTHRISINNAILYINPICGSTDLLLLTLSLSRVHGCLSISWLARTVCVCAMLMYAAATRESVRRLPAC